MMRVYLPSTLPALAAALAEGAIRPAPLTGYAVTARLREGETGQTGEASGLGGRSGASGEHESAGDLEELEYAALSEAADASLAMLADTTPCRVVLAAEVPEAHVTDAAGATSPAAVLVTTEVSARKIVAGHVDDAAAAADVRSAVASLPAAPSADSADNAVARRAFDAARDHELLWYASQELSELTREW